MTPYTDLVRLLKDDAVSGVEGKPTLKQRDEKAYWYAARRVGSEMRFFYIGEDSDEILSKGQTDMRASFDFSVSGTANLVPTPDSEEICLVWSRGFKLRVTNFVRPSEAPTLSTDFRSRQERSPGSRWVVRSCQYR